MGKNKETRGKQGRDWEVGQLQWLGAYHHNRLRCLMCVA
jgi:hypothetical protein